MTPTTEEQRRTPGDGTAPARTGLPIGELVARLSDDTVRPVRDEIRLAQAEMSQKAKAARVGVAMFGGAGICGIYGLGVLIAAAAVGLSMVVAVWAATLIVAGALFAAVGFVALAGRKEFERAGRPMPTETVQSTRQDIDEFKRGLRT